MLHDRPRTLKPCLHDTACCQTGCTTRFDNRLNEQWLFVQHGCQTRLRTGFTTGWMFVYTIQLVVKPVVQPVSQPVVSCKRGIRHLRLSSGLISTVDRSVTKLAASLHYYSKVAVYTNLLQLHTIFHPCTQSLLETGDHSPDLSATQLRLLSPHFVDMTTPLARMQICTPH